MRIRFFLKEFLDNGVDINLLLLERAKNLLNKINAIID